LASLKAETPKRKAVTDDDTIGTLALLALPVLIVWLLILRRQDLNLIWRKIWRKISVAGKVELSVAKRSNKARFIGELAVLLVIAFFVAEILTNTSSVHDDAFFWILVGLPACFLLGRFWWRKYR
jgi:hypothetical protein